MLIMALGLITVTKAGANVPKNEASIHKAEFTNRKAAAREG